MTKEGIIFNVNELGRDNLVARAIEENFVCEGYYLNEEEFKTALLKKLVSESYELLYANSKEEMIEELADVYELFNKILEKNNISINDINSIIVKKNQHRGGFNNEFFLQRVILDKNHKLYKHMIDRKSFYPQS